MSHSFAVAAGLVAITWVAFAQVGSFGFILLDDAGYVESNSHVRQFSIRNVAWAWMTFEQANWHPLTWLSLMLDGQLFGVDPGGFHLSNLVYHTVNVLLLWGALRALTNSFWRSALVAALFAVHPLHVESVAWISARKDVLSTCFGFAALWTYAVYVRRLSRGWYWLTWALFALSLLAKQMLVTWPWVFLLLDYWPLGRFGKDAKPDVWRRLIVEKLPFLALSGIFCVMVVIAQRLGGALQNLQSFSLSSRLQNAVIAYALYLSKTIWPLELAPFYPHSAGTLSWIAVLLAALLLGGVTWLAIAQRRHHPYVLVGWFWFLGTLVPVIGLVQVGVQGLADRYTYTPLVGLFLGVAWLVPAMAPEGWLLHRAIPLTFGALVAGLTLLARQQASYWSDNLRLFEHNASVTRPDAFVEINLAAALEIAGRPIEARLRLERAVELNPQSEVALQRLGDLLHKEGRTSEAINCFQRALAARPDRTLSVPAAETCLRLGDAQATLGQHYQALESYQAAVRYAPSDPMCNLNLALVLRSAGRTQAALPHFRIAAQSEDATPLALANFGVALAELGNDDEGSEYLLRALEKDPNLSLGHEKLGAIRHAQRRYEDALVHWSAAARLKPDNLTIRTNCAAEHVNAGIRLANRGEMLASIGEFRQAVSLVPDYFEGNYYLARALAWHGEPDSAVGHFRRALERQPDAAGVRVELGKLLFQMGKMADAIAEFEHALRLKPDLQEAKQALEQVNNR